MFSYTVSGHYPVTDSNGTYLKLNQDFNWCKIVVLKSYGPLRVNMLLVHQRIL